MERVGPRAKSDPDEAGVPYSGGSRQFYRHVRFNGPVFKLDIAQHCQAFALRLLGHTNGLAPFVFDCLDLHFEPNQILCACERESLDSRLRVRCNVQAQ